jgi:hypothetical protein
MKDFYDLFTLAAGFAFEGQQFPDTTHASLIHDAKQHRLPESLDPRRAACSLIFRQQTLCGFDSRLDCLEQALFVFTHDVAADSKQLSPSERFGRTPHCQQRPVVVVQLKADYDGRSAKLYPGLGWLVERNEIAKPGQALPLPENCINKSSSQVSHANAFQTCDPAADIASEKQERQKRPDSILVTEPRPAPSGTADSASRMLAFQNVGHSPGIRPSPSIPRNSTNCAAIDDSPSFGDRTRD